MFESILLTPLQSLGSYLNLHPVVVLALLLVFPLFWFASGSNSHKGKNLPPRIPHILPFIGNMVNFGMNPVSFLKNAYRTHGDVFTFTMFGREMTYVMGPDGNNCLFNAKLSDVCAEEAYRSLTRPVFGADVVYDVKNSVFMEQKKFIKTGLSLDNLKKYVNFIVEETTQYTKRWKDAGTIDLSKAMAELTIMTASRCLMGPEVRAKLDESVAHLYDDLDKGFQPINFLFERLPLKSYRNRDIAHKKMHDLFLGIIKERRETGRMENSDVLQQLMDVDSYKNGTKFTDKEAANLMIALLMAGQHTSSTTSTWALCHLTDHPEILKDLIAEQKKVLGENMDGVDFNKLKEMVLLDSVIRETLRLNPPIIVIMRKVIKDLEFRGYTIPAGHFLCSSPAISQLDDSQYTNATKFNPYRWIKRDDKIETILRQENELGLDFGFGIVGGSARSYYLPFGAGRHRCIGEPFAYVQLKTILSVIIRDFSFRWPEGKCHPKPDYTSLVVMPTKPVSWEYKRNSHEETVQNLDIKSAC